MTLFDLKNVVDSTVPVWINAGECCDHYENILDAIRDHDDSRVIYITLDGESELTLEIE